MDRGIYFALQGIPPQSWVRIGNDYYFYRGYAPDGMPRLARLKRSPYGHTYYQLDTDRGTATTLQAPRGMHPSTAVLAVLTLVLPAFVLVLLHGQDPILSKTAVPVTFLILLLCTLGCHYGPNRPYDAIAQAEADEAARQAAYEQQARQAQQMAQQALANQQQSLEWQRAVWAQQAAINDQLDPHHDHYRPYGQPPPL